MNPKRTKLHTYAQTIRLRAAERRAMRESLRSYIAYHPIDVVEEVTASQPTIAVSKIQALISFFDNKTIRISSVASVAVVVLLVGVPALAEHAVPGDVLYPVKVHVNEEVKASLQTSPYEKVAWEAERVERRIAEAQLLATEGKLTEEAEATLTEALKEHAETATKEIAQLRETDASEAEVVQVVFESTLDVQTAVLETEGATSVTLKATGTPSGISSIAAAVRGARAEVGDQASATTSISYDRVFARIEGDVVKAEELANSLEKVISESEKEDITRRLNDARDAIASAKELHDKGEGEKSLASLRATLADVQKLTIFLSDINVRSSVALERIVPKKLTEEEQLLALDRDAAKLKTQYGDFVVIANAFADGKQKDELLEKVEALADAIAQIDRLTEDDPEEAKKLIVSAQQLATEITQTLGAEETEDTDS